jgi:hypothetical protein
MRATLEQAEVVHYAHPELSKMLVEQEHAYCAQIRHIGSEWVLALGKRMFVSRAHHSQSPCLEAPAQKIARALPDLSKHMMGRANCAPPASSRAVVVVCVKTVQRVRGMLRAA